MAGGERASALASPSGIKDTTMSELPQIFNGAELIDLTEEVLSDLSDAERDTYFAVAEAYIADCDAKEAVIALRTVLHAAVREGDELQRQFDRVGKVDRIAELRRTIIVQNNARAGLPLPPAPTPDPEAVRLAKAVEDNSNEQNRLRSEAFRADEQTRATQDALHKVILKWQNLRGQPDQTANLRDHLKRLAEYEAKVASGEIVVEEKVVVPGSPLDEIMVRGGRRGYSDRAPRRVR
jgi:hypothetical protein